MFEVNDRKKSRAIAAFCGLAGLSDAWSLDGPTERARQLLEDSSGLTTTHRMVLNAAFALHDGSTALRVAELWVLDATFGEALSDLILALGEGDRALDRWLGRYTQAGRSHTHRLELDSVVDEGERRGVKAR